MFEPILTVTNTGRIGLYNKDFQQSKSYFQRNIKHINNDNFGEHKYYETFVKREIAIHRHPFSYKIIKNENGYVTFNAVNFTSSPKDIIVNGERVTVTQIGTYLKEGKQVPQYAPNIYCNVTMSIKDFGDIVNDITDNKDVLKEKGFTIEHVKYLNENILDKGENKKAYNYTDYLQKSIEPHYNMFLKLQDVEQNIEIKNSKLEEE